MRIKDASVETNFHPTLTRFLFEWVDWHYTRRGLDCVITSGSETSARHGLTSLHYNVPCQACDTRTRYDGDAVPTAAEQLALLIDARNKFCASIGIPPNHFDIILEDEGGPNEHIHTEYQPKRP